MFVVILYAVYIFLLACKKFYLNISILSYIFIINVLEIDCIRGKKKLFLAYVVESCQNFTYVIVY